MCIYQKISLCTQAQNAVFDALSSLFGYWSLDEISKQIGVEYAVLVQVMACEELGSDVVESLAKKLGLKSYERI